MSGLPTQRFRAQLNAPERLLWSRLRLFRGSGFHFRKQAPFQDYVLDFVCHSRRLVVEVDGSQHAEERQAQHDFVRDAILRRHGYEVLRVSASDVMRNLEGVMAQVDEAIHLQALRARMEAEEPQS
jgi:very-short-patch-repair endonuclease